MAKSGRYRFSIGIDLGTSNCALCYADLREEQPLTRLLEIPQWESPRRSGVFRLLPSFAYYPRGSFGEDAAPAIEDSGPAGEGAAAGNPGPAGKSRHVVGVHARDVFAQEPQRVVASAKSWLAHAGVDRRARILPWGSREIPDREKLSAVEASALYLVYMREVWDREIARGDARSFFIRQHIVITVPASFDQAAQRLTLEAARLAGYPDNTRLLEEPQAAFHAWLERHPGPDALKLALGAADARDMGTAIARNVLVCDVGGGTSDFSLFAIDFGAGKTAQIQRLAVSEHILLGGDNMDLALAHRLEILAAGGSGEERLEPRAWQRLVAESRRLKERVLAGLSQEDFRREAVYRVGVEGSGGSLFAQARTAEIGAGEIVEMLGEGFFPVCGKDDGPRGDETGLREMGLPYARDPAVTRHLAAFLTSPGAGERQVHAVLFNGGALTPAYLRERLAGLVGAWQGGRAPAVLENDELDLAVARGAAAHGARQALGLKPRIAGGTAHGYYLEVSPREGREARYLLCLMPRGTEIEQVKRIESLDLALAVNRPVEFRLYHSAVRPGDRAGNLVRHTPGEFRELPPLRTVARLEPDRARTLGRNEAPVAVHAVLNSLGLLQVTLVSTDRRLKPPERWELEFDMRARHGEEPEAGEAPEEEPLASAGREAVADILSRPFTLGVLRQIEEALGRKRKAWPRLWLRQMWEPLYGVINRRAQSPDYEAAWLNAAGFFLRPGFGTPLDDFRMDQLWRINAVGPAFPRAKVVREQYWLLWRRVAGGLSADRQLALFREARPVLETHGKQSDEAAGMAASFELLPLEERQWLLDSLLAGMEQRGEGHVQHYLWALGRILSRVPLYAGEQSVLPPEAVERCFAYFRDHDWNDARLSPLPSVFSQACRLTGHRGLDVSPALRAAAAEKLRAAGAPERLLRPLRQVVPVEREDLNLLFGESLPVGLAIRRFS